MLEFLNDTLGVIIIIVLFVYGYKWLRGRHYAKAPDGTSEKIGILCGEIQDITEENGRSRIEVINPKGEEKTGYTHLTIKELESLYVGKGYVEIPVVLNKE